MRHRALIGRADILRIAIERTRLIVVHPRLPARAALGAFLRAAHEIRDQGTFTYTKDAASGNELNEFFATAERKWPTPR